MDNTYSLFIQYNWSIDVMIIIILKYIWTSWLEQTPVIEKNTKRYIFWILPKKTKMCAQFRDQTDWTKSDHTNNQPLCLEMAYVMLRGLETKLLNSAFTILITQWSCELIWKDWELNSYKWIFEMSVKKIKKFFNLEKTWKCILKEWELCHWYTCACFHESDCWYEA